MEDAHYGLAAAILVSSLLSVIYIGRVVEALYFRDPADDDGKTAEAPVSMVAATWVLVGASVALGLYASPLVETAERAAAGLLGSGA